MLKVCFAPFTNSILTRIILACSPHCLSIRSKIKCLAEQPACSSCVKRKTKCVYNTRVRQKSASPLSNEGGCNTSTMRSNGVPAASQENFMFDALLSPTSDHRSTHSMVLDAATSAGSATEHPGPSTENFGEIFPDFFPDQADLFAMPDPNDFDYNQDWLFGQPSASDWDSFPGKDAPLLQSMDISLFRSRLPSDSPRSASFPLENGWVNGDLPVPGPQNIGSPRDPWPVESHDAGPTQRLTLPPFGMSEQHRARKYFSIPPLSNSTTASLRHYFQLPSERNPWLPVRMSSFPSSETLDLCIDSYFAHFHPVSLLCFDRKMCV